MAQLIKGKQIANQSITISGNTGNVISKGNLDMLAYQVLVTNSPTLDSHLANKAYVDAVAQGVHPHAPVRIVLTGQTTLSGVFTYDGVLLVEGDRVLVAGQTDARFNGIYNAHSGGTAWTRTLDADGNPNNEIELGDFTFVASGTTNGNSGWVLGKSNSPDMPITPDVDTQEWYKMAAPGSYTGNNLGIVISGNVINLVLDGLSLEQSASGVRVSTSYTTSVAATTSSAISTSMSTEVVTRSSVDAVLSSAISTGLSTEIGTRSSVDVVLSNALSTEIVTSSSVDVVLSNAISTGLSTEIGTRSSVDVVLSTAISTGLSTEIGTRSSVDVVLSNAISTASGGVSTETSLRTVADTSLQTAISTVMSTEVSTRTSIDTVLSSALSTEVSNRTVADTSLQTSISTVMSTEVSTRTSVDVVLSTAISTGLSTEIGTRSSVDVVLSTAISTGLSTEIGTRSSVDAVLSTAISTTMSTEVGVRTSVDASLATAIDGMNSPTNWEQDITPSVSGATTNVVVSTTAFAFASGSYASGSTSIHLNGIQYVYGVGQGGNKVFYTLATPVAGAGTTLYFDGVVADFAIETTDTVNLKFVTIT